MYDGSSIPRKYQKIIYQLRKELKDNNVRVIFMNTGKPNPNYSGYFSGDSKSKSQLIYVDQCHSFREWFHTFIHEYNHFLQFQEDKHVFKAYDWADGIMEEWYKHGKNPEHIDEALQEIQRIELNCERRTVDMLLGMGFMNSSNWFIQRFNGVLLAMELSKETRNARYGLWNHPSLWKKLPENWFRIPCKVPGWYREEYLKLSQRGE